MHGHWHNKWFVDSKEEGKQIRGPLHQKCDHCTKDHNLWTALTTNIMHRCGSERVFVFGCVPNPSSIALVIFLEQILFQTQKSSFVQEKIEEEAII